MATSLEDSDINFDEEEALLNEARKPKKEKSAGYYVRQAGAGFLDMLNLPYLYAAPGAIGALTESDADREARLAKDPNADPPYALPGHKTAMEWGDIVNESVNNVAGVDDPEGFKENAARLSSLLLPAKWLTVAGRIPKAAEGASKLAKTTNTAARVAGKTVDALVVPGVQGKYTPARAAANFGIPYAINQGVTEMSETPQDPQDTVIDHLPGTEVTTPDTAPIDFDKEEQLLRNKQAYTNPDIDFDDEEMELMRQEDNANDTWKKSLVAAGVAAGVYAGARRMLRRTNEAVDARSKMPSLTEPSESQNIASRGELAKGAVFDEAVPAASQLEKAAGKEAADTFRDQSTLGNQVGVAAQHSEAFSTGRYPVMIDMGDQTPIRSQPLKDLLFAADQMDPVKRAAVDDVLLAMDELDQMKLAKAAPTDKSLLKGKTVKELNDLVNVHMQDPEVRALVGAFQDQTRTMLRYMKQTGLISSEQAGVWGSNHPHFMPREQFERQRLRDLLMAPQGKGDHLDFLEGFASGKRSLELEGRGTDFKGTFMPPTTVLSNEQRKIIRAAQVNNTRRIFFDRLRGEDGSYKMKGVYEVSPDSRGNDIVRYYVNGKPRAWKVKDQAIRAYLQNGGQGRQLDGVLKVMNTMRQAKQFAITGPVLNPTFQVVSGQLWDPVWASLVLPKGRTMGGVKGPAVGVLGAVKGFKAHHQARMAEAFRQEALLRELGQGRKSFVGKLFSNLTSKLPEDRLKQLADSYADAYAESPVALYRMMGGSGVRVWNDYEQLASLNIMDPATRRKWVEALMGSFNKNFTPDLLQGRNLGKDQSWLGYYAHSLVDAMHNGTRYQLMHLNKSKAGKLTKDMSVTEAYINDLARLARDNRELLDTSKHGFDSGMLGKSTTALTSTMPYANVMLQGFGRLGRAFKENPERVGKVITAIGFAGASVAYLNSRWSDQQREWYWNVLTPEQRAGALWIPNPNSDDPRDSIKIPLEPTTAAIAMLGQNFFDASFGIRNGNIDPNVMKNLDDYFGFEDETGMTPFDRNMEDAQAGARRLLGLGLPPILEATAPLAGARFNIEGQLVPLEGQQVQQYNSLYGNVPTRYVDGVVSTQVDAIMNGLLGPIATGTFVDMIEGANMQLKKKPGDVLGALDEVKDQYVTKTYGSGKVDVKPFTIEARELKDYERAMDAVDAKWEDVQRKGMTRQDRGIALQGRIAPGFDSPEQQQMFQVVRPALQKLKRIYRDSPGGISDVIKQKASVMSDPRITLAQRKEREAELNTKLQELQTEYLRAIQALESQVGEQLGVEFDFRDWADNKFVTQP